MGDESSDLLIFKLRGGVDLEESAGEAAPISAESSTDDLPEEVTEPNPDVVVSAKGLKCSVHPWRDAYAVCSRCGLPFCYVDIAKKNGRFVCLDDITAVETEDIEKNVSKNNFFTDIGGVFLIFNAAYLLYLFYPQAGVLYSNISISLTINGIVKLLASYYYPTLANFVAVIISLIAGLMVMSSGRRRIGIAVSLIIFMLMSYEFMNSSGVNYLILPMALVFMSMVLLVLGNMSAARAANSLVDEEYRHVEWPRPEVF